MHVAAGTSVRHACCGWFSRTVAAAWWRVGGRAGQSAQSGVVECRIGDIVQAPFLSVADMIIEKSLFLGAWQVPVPM